MGSLTGVQPLTGWPPGCLLVHLISGVSRLWECPSYYACNSPLNVTLVGHILPVALIICVTPERVVHSTRIGTRDLGFSLTDNSCVTWDPLLVTHLLLFGFPIYDLSTLFSGKSVHPDDWCLTTLGSLAHVLCGVLARAARGTRLHGTNITSGQ